MSARPWPPLSDDAYHAAVVRAVGAELTAALARVELLVFDADGVLTPGNLLYGPRGEALKEFDVRDGLGLVLARTGGLRSAVLTGRNSAIVAHRCRELRFDAIKIGRFDKQAALTEIFAETGCGAAAALYVGDDLIDLPALHAVGLPVAVPAAPDEVKAACRYVTRAEGGRGAVREVVDLVLKSARRYATALTRLGDRAWQPRPDETASDPDEQDI
jgi:3-deoxy-D-manno-octulosonate 8-phosphate phosphatase (KDO 8-P phosphatase)